MLEVKHCPIVGDMISSDKPQIVNKIYACFCNQLANDKYPDKCDAVCPHGGMIGSKNDCICTDPQRAGEYCHQKVCKLGRKGFCTGSIIGPTYKWEACETGVNYDRLDEIASCNCKYGTLQGDRCECNADYSGPLCEDYVYKPPTNPGSGSGHNGGSSSNTGGKNTGNNIPIMVGVVVFMGFVVFAILVLVCYFRRRRYSSGAVIYSPAPVQAPAASGAPYPVQQYAPNPAPGQPVTGYHQPTGTTTTYTFQPPGGLPGHNSGPQAPHYPIASAPPPPAAYYDPSNTNRGPQGHSSPVADGGGPPSYTEATREG